MVGPYIQICSSNVWLSRMNLVDLNRGTRGRLRLLAVR